MPSPPRGQAPPTPGVSSRRMTRALGPLAAPKLARCSLRTRSGLRVAPRGPRAARARHARASLALRSAPGTGRCVGEGKTRFAEGFRDPLGAPCPWSASRWDACLPRATSGLLSSPLTRQRCGFGQKRRGVAGVAGVATSLRITCRATRKVPGVSDPPRPPDPPGRRVSTLRYNAWVPGQGVEGARPGSPRTCWGRPRRTASGSRRPVPGRHPGGMPASGARGPRWERGGSWALAGGSRPLPGPFGPASLAGIRARREGGVV
jgi:hypothetical protein